jgi:hypothetical protein
LQEWQLVLLLQQTQHALLQVGELELDYSPKALEVAAELEELEG